MQEAKVATCKQQNTIQLDARMLSTHSFYTSAPMFLFSQLSLYINVLVHLLNHNGSKINSIDLSV